MTGVQTCALPIFLVEHVHDEFVYVGFNSKTYFKNCKNAYFKYGGVGIQFAEPFYKSGLLSQEEEEFNGAKIVPFDFVLAHVPEAPKTPDEIEAMVGRTTTGLEALRKGASPQPGLAELHPVPAEQAVLRLRQPAQRRHPRGAARSRRASRTCGSRRDRSRR